MSTIPYTGMDSLSSPARALAQDALECATALAAKYSERRRLSNPLGMPVGHSSGPNTSQVSNGTDCPMYSSPQKASGHFIELDVTSSTNSHLPGFMGSSMDSEGQHFTSWNLSSSLSAEATQSPASQRPRVPASPNKSKQRPTFKDSGNSPKGPSSPATESERQGWRAERSYLLQRQSKLEDELVALRAELQQMKQIHHIDIHLTASSNSSTPTLLSPPSTVDNSSSLTTFIAQPCLPQNFSPAGRTSPPVLVLDTHRSDGTEMEHGTSADRIHHAETPTPRSVVSVQSDGPRKAMPIHGTDGQLSTISLPQGQAGMPGGMTSSTAHPSHQRQSISLSRKSCPPPRMAVGLGEIMPLHNGSSPGSKSREQTFAPIAVQARDHEMVRTHYISPPEATPSNVAHALSTTQPTIRGQGGHGASPSQGNSCNAEHSTQNYGSEPMASFITQDTSTMTSFNGSGISTRTPSASTPTRPKPWLSKGSRPSSRSTSRTSSKSPCKRRPAPRSAPVGKEHDNISSHPFDFIPAGTALAPKIRDTASSGRLSSRTFHSGAVDTMSRIQSASRRSSSQSTTTSHSRSRNSFSSGVHSTAHGPFISARRSSPTPNTSLGMSRTDSSFRSPIRQILRHTSPMERSSSSLGLIAKDQSLEGKGLRSDMSPQKSTLKQSSNRVGISCPYNPAHHGEVKDLADHILSCPDQPRQPQPASMAKHTPSSQTMSPSTSTHLNTTNQNLTTSDPIAPTTPPSLQLSMVQGLPNQSQDDSGHDPMAIEGLINGLMNAYMKAKRQGTPSSMS